MGFFGFLKKPAVEAPKQPQPENSVSDIPLPPPTTSDSVPPPLENAPPPESFEHADDLGFQTPEEEPSHELLPAVDADKQEVDSLETPESVQLRDTPTLPEAQEQGPDISLDIPTESESAADWSAESGIATPSFSEDDDIPSENNDIPDFSEEEIAAAEDLNPEPEVRHEELPDLEPLPEMVHDGVEKLYVPAVGYRDALTTISEFQKSVRKGDKALDTFTQQIAAHSTEMSIFAEQLNTMQEELIRMDNVLNER